MCENGNKIDLAVIDGPLEADFVNGKLYWYHQTNKLPIGVKSGQEAGYIGAARGQITLNQKRYGHSRIIFALWHGRDIRPGYVIDHIDRDPTNDRIINLRELTQLQNVWNKSNNTTGVPCVFRYKDRWRAQIWDGLKRLNLGYFSDIQDAKAAVVIWLQKNKDQEHVDFYLSCCRV